MKRAKALDDQELAASAAWPPTDLVFVYGALMAGGDGLTGGRKAWLPDYAVRFVARGVPVLEPTFAALLEAPGELAHGVVFETSHAAQLRMRDQESGYRSTLVVVQTESGPVQASTFVLLPSERLEEERLPSARYLRLLARGARTHDLPHAEELERKARRAPQLSSYLSVFKPVVLWLTPHIGFVPAVILVVIVLLGAISALATVLFFSVVHGRNLLNSR